MAGLHALNQQVNYLYTIRIFIPVHTHVIPKVLYKSTDVALFLYKRNWDLNYPREINFKNKFICNKMLVE